MKRATRGILTFVTAFLIVFSTFGNAFFVAEASEPTAIVETVSETESGTEVEASAEQVSAAGSSAAGSTEEMAEVEGETKKEQTREETPSEVKKEEPKEEETKEEETKGASGTQEEKKEDEYSSEKITVTASVAAGEVERGTKIALGCDTEGANIYYNFGGDAYRLYDEEIEIEEDITIQAYAALYEEETGEIFEFKYTVAQPVKEIKAEAVSGGTQAEYAYRKVTDGLNDGDQIIFVINGYTMLKKNKKLISTDITVEDGIAIPSDDTAVFTIEKDEDGIAFKYADGTYITGKKSSNVINLQEAPETHHKWKLVEKKVGDSVVAYYVKNLTAGTNAGNKFYLGRKDNGDFQDYENIDANESKIACEIYRYEEEKVSVSVATPTASLESGSKVEFGTEVTLSCETEGATIKYSFDGETYKAYENPVEITKNGTVSAYAELDDSKSDTAEFSYEIFAGSKITDIKKLSDNQDFVLVFGGTTALSATADQSKLKGAKVKINDEMHLTYNDEVAAFAKLNAVKTETDGQYYISSEFPATEDGNLTTATEVRYLTTGATGNSLAFETEKNEYSLWAFELEEDGSFLVKSVNAVYHDKKKNIDTPQYFEFCNGFFTAYNYVAETDKKDNFTFTAYTVPEREGEKEPEEPDTLPTSTIAEARAGEMNEVFAVEGYVTSGTSNPDTTFIDTIYIQDETAGIYIFPYAEAGLEIGTRVRITGFVAQYQGDMELKVISVKILDDEPYVWEPKEVDTKTAMDYTALGGSLLKTTGKVTRVAVGADGNIEEFWLADATGSEAAIFIDGYIKSGTTGDEGRAALSGFVKVGAEVSAAGVLYMHPEGSSDVSVPVFRVRNCDDIVLVKAAPDTDSGSGSGSSNEFGSGSSSASSDSGSSSGSSDSGSTSGSSSSQPTEQSVLGAVRKAVDTVIDTIADGIEPLVKKILGEDDNDQTSSTGSSEGEVVGSVTGDNTDQVAAVENPAGQSALEQTDNGKTVKIVEEATASAIKPKSRSRKVARAAATTVVIVSGLGLAAIGLRKMLLLLHVIR